MARANEEKLSALHGKVAEVMIGALDRAETLAGLELYNEDGEVIEVPAEVSPALLSACTKFLKDNEITVQLAEGSTVQDLQNKLKKRVGNVTYLNEKQA